MMCGGPGGGSWIWDRLPDNSAAHTNSAAGVALLNNVISKRGVYINNTGSYGMRFFVPRRGTKKQKVVARGAAAANAELKAVLEDDGLPIPDPFVLDQDVGTFPDLTACILDIETDTYYEVHVMLPPGHPSGHPTYYSAEWGGRMSNASQRLNGHWVNATPSGSNWGRGSRNERSYHGASASHMPMAMLSITRDDWARKRIDHALGFMMPGYVMPGQEGSYVVEPPVWPAQGADAASRPAMPNGSRFRLKRSYMTDAQVEAIANPDLRMMVRQAMNHGIVLYDSDAYYVKQESGVYIPNEPAEPLIYRAEQHALDGMDWGAVFAAFPWSQMERIATGSDSLFTPVV